MAAKIGLLTFQRRSAAALFKCPVHTAPKTHFISVIKTDQFMLYGEEIVVFAHINTKHINTAQAERTVVE
jgi:hypothetical protein